jgi:hypothetical protein
MYIYHTHTHTHTHTHINFSPPVVTLNFLRVLSTHKKNAKNKSKKSAGTERHFFDRELRGPLSSGKQYAERIYDIIYHISSSPYYCEDIHTMVLLKGVMIQG